MHKAGINVSSLSSTVRYENSIKILLFIWIEQFLRGDWDLLEKALAASQMVIPRRSPSFPVLLLPDLLNSETRLFSSVFSLL